MPEEPQSPEEYAILVDFPGQHGLVQASIVPDLDEWLE